MPGSPADEIVVVVNADGFSVDAAEIERAVRHVLADAEVDSGEVSVTLLGDDGIRAINRDYLDRDRPTDVIAFSLGEDDVPLGDVYVGIEEAVRNAALHDIDVSEELVRLAIHGTLHVLGHDHVDGPDRIDGPMFALQERLVREVRAGT